MFSKTEKIYSVNIQIFKSYKKDRFQRIRTLNYTSNMSTHAIMKYWQNEIIF